MKTINLETIGAVRETPEECSVGLDDLAATNTQ